MNFGIGYGLLAGFLQSDTYRFICIAGYAMLFACPFVFIILNRKAGLFISCMSAAFIAVKLLSLYIVQQNPDEGQHLLMTYSLINGGVPFRDFEGQGNGPLNALYLALFSFGDISFFTAHLAALFAELACCVMFFFAVMKLCGLRIAAALSGFVFIYFSIYLYDVTAYNNETLFCMLISLWLLLFACRNGRKSILFTECFVLGLLPWVKLQFAPFTVCCLILSIARGVFVQQSREYCQVPGCTGPGDVTDAPISTSAVKWHQILKDTLTASAGAAVPTMLILAYLALNGVWKWFWLFYIRVNIEHVSISFSEYLSELPLRMVLFADMNLFWLPVSTILSCTAVGLAHRRNSPHKSSPGRDYAILLLVLFALTAFFATTRTMSIFDHYINIIVPSCVILIALRLAISSSEKLRKNCAIAILAAVEAVAAYDMMTLNDIQNIRTIQQLGFVREDEYPFKEAVKYLNSHVSPGEPIVVWGWETGMPIYSGHPSATTTNFIYPLVDKKFDRQLQEELRSRYVQDIIQNKPAAIADLVCPASFAYRYDWYHLSEYAFMKDIADKYYEAPVSFPVTVSAFFGEGLMPWHHSRATDLETGSVRIYLRKKEDRP